MNKEEYEKISKNQAMAEIAYKIVKTSGHPMHYKEISRIMLDEVGYCSQGETPWLSLNAKIGQDKRFLKKDGIVELSEWKHPPNNTPKTLEKSQCWTDRRHSFEGFKKIPDVKIPRTILKIERKESYGTGIIEHDNSPKTYREPIDRTR